MAARRAPLELAIAGYTVQRGRSSYALAEDKLAAAAPPLA